MKERTFSVEEISTIVENCNERTTDMHCNNFEHCPLKGECLYYLTGDDSLLSIEKS